MLNMIKRYYSEEQDLTAKSLKGIEDTENTDIQEFEKIMTGQEFFGYIFKRK